MADALSRSTVSSICKMYLGGMGTTAIARQYGISRVVVWKYVSRAGILQPARKVHKVDTTTVCALYAAGLSQIAIARRLGVHRATVWNHLRRGGTFRPIRKIAA